jgi:hypothetical protein
MGMLSDGASASVANEVIKLIDIEIDKHLDDTVVTQALSELRIQVLRLRKTIEGGWF